MRRRRAVLAAGVAVLSGAIPFGVAPAAAHGTDPTLVPVLHAISPALPDGVVVQVRTGVSEQMLVANPTADVLTVLGPDGTPFLRVSKAGVSGNVAEPFFHRTLNPPDVPPRIPPSAKAGAKPRWVVLGRTGEFGWFEPRLHPSVPGSESAGAVVSRWQVDMRLGGKPVSVSGALERQAMTGNFVPAVDARDDDLAVTVAAGRVPALLLIAPPERRIVVTGADGEDFLRLGPDGVHANTGSPHFRDNLDFVDRAGGSTGWVKVGEAGRVRWLDSRLQYTADRPPQVVERAAKPAELGRWAIPLTVDGAPTALAGTLSWVPFGAPLGTGGNGTSWLPYGIGAGFLAGAAALVVAARRRVSPGRARRADG